MYLILSGSAIDAFENHYWYLTKNIVPLALWSNKVLPQERNTVTNSTPATKSNITDAAFKSQGRYGMNFRKPEFPKKKSYCKHNYFWFSWRGFVVFILPA